MSSRAAHREAPGARPHTGGAGRAALWVALATLVLGSSAEAKPAKRRPKKPRTTESASWASAPSARYGALSREQCLAELRARKIAFSTVREARGVLAPVRLAGALDGVTWRTEAPAETRAKSPHEVFDCRVVLSLSDFSALLRRHSVETAIIFSAWRPPPKSWPADKAATRHPGALAVDLKRLERAASAEGPRELLVERDWTPHRGVAPCTGNPSPATAEGRLLRSIFCEADEKRLFTTMLSPNYDKAHENHFHLEVTPGVKWRLVL